MQVSNEHRFFSIEKTPQQVDTSSPASPSLTFLAEMIIDANEIIKKIKRNLSEEKTDKDSFNSLKMLVEYMELSIYDMMTYAGCDQAESEKKDSVSVLFEKLRYFSKLSKKTKASVSIEVEIAPVLKNYSVDYRSRPANTYFKALLVIVENAVKYIEEEKPGKIRIQAKIVDNNFQVRVLDNSALIKNPDSIFNPQKELVLEEIVQQKTVRESWHIGIPASVKNMRKLPGGNMSYSEHLTDEEKRDGFTKCIIVELPMETFFADDVMDIEELLDQLTENERKRVIYYDTHGAKNMAGGALLLNLWQEMSTLLEQLLDVLEQVHCGKKLKPSQNIQGVRLSRDSVIVVVDDDPAMLLAISKVLKTTLSVIGVNDTTILSFSSAKEALENMPDQCSLVFTDYNMDGYDGVEFARKLKEKFKQNPPPTVLLTADNQMIKNDINFPLDLFADVIGKRSIRDSILSFLQLPKMLPEHRGATTFLGTGGSGVVDTQDPVPPPVCCNCSIF